MGVSTKRLLDCNWQGKRTENPTARRQVTMTKFYVVPCGIQASAVIAGGLFLP